MIRGGVDPQHDVAEMPTERMGPPAGALPPMRMTASWLGPEVDLQNTSLSRQQMRQWRAPSDPQQTAPSDAKANAKSPCRSSSLLRALRRQGAAKHERR